MRIHFYLIKTASL